MANVKLKSEDDYKEPQSNVFLTSFPHNCLFGEGHRKVEKSSHCSRGLIMHAHRSEKGQEKGAVTSVC